MLKKLLNIIELKVLVLHNVFLCKHLRLGALVCCLWDNEPPDKRNAQSKLVLIAVNLDV